MSAADAKAAKKLWNSTGVKRRDGQHDCNYKPEFAHKTKGKECSCGRVTYHETGICAPCRVDGQVEMLCRIERMNQGRQTLEDVCSKYL